MEPAPGQVIRSLRRALDMSQVEFARAAGWAPSTISSWERGRATPSRLAFKTILAFAEERGVRYRPAAAPRRTLPVGAGRALVDVPALRLPASRGGAAFPPGAARAMLGDWREEIARRIEAERRASRHALVASERPAEDRREREVAMPFERPRWQAEATFRFSVGAAPDRAGRVRRAFPWVAALVLGVGAGLALRGVPSGPVAPAPLAVAADDPTAAPAAERPTMRRAPTNPSRPGPALAGSAAASAAALQPAGAPAVIPPPPNVARLESVVRIGDRHRAIFRTPERSLTVVPGDHVGPLLVAGIADDAVTLLDRTGAARALRLGSATPLD